MVLIFGLALFIAMMGVAASARAATARDAAYNLVLDRRKMKITYHHDGRDDNVRSARACDEYAVPLTDPVIVGRFVYQCDAVDREDKGTMGIVEVVAGEMRRDLVFHVR